MILLCDFKAARLFSIIIRYKTLKTFTPLETFSYVMILDWLSFNLSYTEGYINNRKLTMQSIITLPKFNIL